jgi:MarR-like DNA-binding transcriptional regulator SgrR of sgrS sRNA
LQGNSKSPADITHEPHLTADRRPPAAIAGNPDDVLTMADVAEILRCSKSHVANLINGKVQGAPVLTHVAMGRRKVVRRHWLVTWMEAFKRQC